MANEGGTCVLQTGLHIGCVGASKRPVQSLQHAYSRWIKKMADGSRLLLRHAACRVYNEAPLQLPKDVSASACLTSGLSVAVHCMVLDSSSHPTRRPLLSTVKVHTCMRTLRCDEAECSSERRSNIKTQLWTLRCNAIQIALVGGSVAGGPTFDPLLTPAINIYPLVCCLSSCTVRLM